MRTSSISAVFLIGLSGVAMAQQPSQQEVNAIRQSCRADYESYCSNVPAGGKASLQCLQRNISALSPACHQAVAAVGGSGAVATPAAPPATTPPPPPMGRRQEIALMRRACGDDFHAYCSNVELGGGRALGCLMRNEARLSPQCRGALAEARPAR